MDEILFVHMTKKGGANVFLDLPATPWERLDVQDRLRLEDGEVPYISFEGYRRFVGLGAVLSKECSLEELNVLAQKLSELDEEQCAAFEGLLQMEGGPVTVPRAIDLAYSTDCCHVVLGATNDAQIGRFFAENGFVPGADALSDDLFELLDFQRIGREMRQGEDGIFTRSGYVLRHSAPAEVYKTLDLTLKTPDYAVLLELENGERLELPSDRLPDTAPVRCLDCRIPALLEAITEEKDLRAIARFARTLAEMGPEQITAYKALLEVIDCQDLGTAQLLADGLDSCLFTPQLTTLPEVAREELSMLLNDGDAALLLPHLDLYQYGHALIQHCGGALTDYGLIKRKDGQDIRHAPPEQTKAYAGSAVQPDILSAFPYLEKLTAHADAETVDRAGRCIAEALDGRGEEGLRQLQAAMEYEDCADLSEAAEIAGRLDSYEFIPVSSFREDSRQALLELGLDPRVVDACFSFENYAAIRSGFEDLYTSRGTGLYVHRDMGLEQQGLGGMEMM